MRRPLKESDFEQYGLFGERIRAIYRGNSYNLCSGEEYVVTKSSRKDKVTVQLRYNKKLGRSNGGVKFAIDSFEIDVEDKTEINVEDKTMVTLNDLTPEDKERLLEEAREIVENENIQKDARAMYALKKKELINNTTDEIIHTIKLKTGPQATKLRGKIVDMSNYLYSLNKVNPRITSKHDWEIFEGVCNKVKECIVHSVRREG